MKKLYDEISNIEEITSKGLIYFEKSSFPIDRQFKTKNLGNNPSKRGVYLDFKTKGNVYDRQSSIVNEINSISMNKDTIDLNVDVKSVGGVPHYILDLKNELCIRTLTEDNLAYINSKYPNHIYVEVYGLSERKKSWKMLVGSFVKEMKNKH